MPSPQTSAYSNPPAPGYVPDWNGRAAVAALRWCGQNDAPIGARLVLIATALISNNDDGLVGPVPNAELANATGLGRHMIAGMRSWLARNGAITEAKQPGLSAVLAVAQAVRDCIPTADELAAAAAQEHRPAPATRCRGRP